MDFSIISPKEFENLCSDILSHCLKKDVRTFKEGADGGIDIAFRNKHCFIMGQCKRYTILSYRRLMKDLEKEATKVKSNKPSEYYVFTSMSLNPSQIKSIYDLFAPFMNDINAIFDKEKIESFLNAQESAYIKRKNLKLWIDSYNTLSEILKPDLSIHVDELMRNIESHKKLYIQTNIFFDARKALQDKRIILVTGKPGVGKSTLCEMVLMDFVLNNSGSRVIYSSLSDYNQLLSNLDKLSKIKEIIYIDDFLGQSCVALASDKIKSIKLLLSYVSNHDNVYLIINSRTSVVKEAKHIDDDISDRFDDLVNIDIQAKDYTKIEKAQILYSHIVTSDLDDERIDILLGNKKYLKIIEHKNYNPRLIQYMVNKRMYGANPARYLDYIEYLMEHPEKVWEKEYSLMIYPEDRLLMETLYTLSDYHVEEKVLEKAFNAQKGNPDFSSIDLSKANLFNSSKARLIGSFLNVLSFINKEESSIEVADPSVNDFLKVEFANKSKDQIDNLAKRAICVDQLMRLYGDDFYDERLIRHIDCNFLEHAIVVNPHNYYKAVLCIASQRTNNSERFKKSLLEAINYFVTSTQISFDFGKKYSLGDLVVELVSDESLDCYDFLLEKNAIKQLIQLIRLKCYFYMFIEIYQNSTRLNSEQKETILYFALEDAVNDAISEMDKRSLIEKDDLEEYTDCYSDGYNFDTSIDEDGLASLVLDRAKDQFVDMIESFEEFNEIRKVYNYSDEEILECFETLFDAKDIVDNFLYDDRDYDYDRYKEYRENQITESDNYNVDDDIERMFQNLLSEKQ